MLQASLLAGTAVNVEMDLEAGAGVVLVERAHCFFNGAGGVCVGMLMPGKFLDAEWGTGGLS